MASSPPSLFTCPLKTYDRPWLFAEHPDFSGDGPLHDFSECSDAGKWLIFVSPGEIDRIWWLHCHGDRGAVTRSGLRCSTALGKDVHPSALPRLRRSVIYRLDDDTAGGEELRRILGALGDFGFQHTLRFKRDATTFAGLYGRGSVAYVSDPGSRNYRRS